MDSLARAVEAADSGWPVVAIAVIGLYLLLWKFGDKLLVALRENTAHTVAAKEIAQDAKDVADGVAKDIVTNHGSKNLGDAIDRLTEWTLTNMEEGREGRRQVRDLQTAFLTYVIENDKRAAAIEARLQDKE